MGNFWGFSLDPAAGIKHHAGMNDASPARGERLRRLLLRVLPWLPALAAAADWAALKTGLLHHPPWVLAALVGLVLLMLLARLGVLAAEVARGRRPRLAGAGQLVLFAGLLLALGAGLANWLLALQGFVILHEGEAVPLAGGSHLQHFEGGPLARIEEMEMVLALVEVELLPGAGGTFYPESRLEVQRSGGEPRRLAVNPRAGAAAGSLRFFQGAFGFAPRIVILRGGEEVFDRVVPFTTERHGAQGLSFAGLFTLEKEALEVAGSVDLASLDAAMRGHANLELEVSRGGALLGRGSLLPGHFADIGEDYRVGFAGMEMWSEIDLSRRNYGRWVLAGLALALAGGLLWAAARWKRS